MEGVCFRSRRDKSLLEELSNQLWIRLTKESDDYQEVVEIIEGKLRRLNQSYKLNNRRKTEKDIII